MWLCLLAVGGLSFDASLHYSTLISAQPTRLQHVHAVWRTRSRVAQLRSMWPCLGAAGESNVRSLCVRVCYGPHAHTTSRHGWGQRQALLWLHSTDLSRLHCTMRLAAAFHCDAHALHDKHARTQHTELGTDERRGQRKLAGFSHSPTAVRNADTVVQRLACSWAMSTHLWQWCCSPFCTCTACGNPFCTTALGSCVANSCTRCGCACAADEAQRQC
jgi:hypothetical protein